jgi:hypothetical protein
MSDIDDGLTSRVSAPQLDHDMDDVVKRDAGKQRRFEEEEEEEEEEEAEREEEEEEEEEEEDVGAGRERKRPKVSLPPCVVVSGQNGKNDHSIDTKNAQQQLGSSTSKPR